MISTSGMCKSSFSEPALVLLASVLSALVGGSSFFLMYRSGSVGRRERRGRRSERVEGKEAQRAQGSKGSQHWRVPRSLWSSTRR